MTKEINAKLSALVEELKSLVEEEVPDWEKGDPVPSGYKVVFGRLVKPRKGVPRSKRTPIGQHLPTMAWKASAKAHQHDDAEAHEDAAKLHDRAAKRHEEFASSPWGDGQKNKKAAAEHTRWADYHRASAESSPTGRPE